MRIRAHNTTVETCGIAKLLQSIPITLKYANVLDIVVKSVRSVSGFLLNAYDNLNGKKNPGNAVQNNGLNASINYTQYQDGQGYGASLENHTNGQDLNRKTEISYMHQIAQFFAETLAGTGTTKMYLAWVKFHKGMTGIQNIWFSIFSILVGNMTPLPKNGIHWKLTMQPFTLLFIDLKMGMLRLVFSHLMMIAYTTSIAKLATMDYRVLMARCGRGTISQIFGKILSLKLKHKHSVNCKEEIPKSVPISEGTTIVDSSSPVEALEVHAYNLVTNHRLMSLSPDFEAANTREGEREIDRKSNREKVKRGKGQKLDLKIFVQSREEGESDRQLHLFDEQSIGCSKVSQILFLNRRSRNELVTYICIRNVVVDIGT
ncbi:hypothetical protein VNO77_07971 [Canavalia gladiata]|uniref:Uncharacterized protein n=1 Tax=Canavalia gladiata TaxID=3824 RepID=A0AAN9MDK9_CANGL